MLRTITLLVVARYLHLARAAFLFTYPTYEIEIPIQLFRTKGRRISSSMCHVSLSSSIGLIVVRCHTILGDLGRHISRPISIYRTVLVMRHLQIFDLCRHVPLTLKARSSEELFVDCLRTTKGAQGHVPRSWQLKALSERLAIPQMSIHL